MSSRGLAPLFAAVLVACAAPAPVTEAEADLGCFAPTGRYTLCDGALHAPDGARAWLRGVNVAQSRKLPPYTGGTRAADFAAMTALGLDHVRLIWTWAAVMPGPDELDEAYLDRLEAEVRAAGEAGLAVVLDSHQDLYGEAIRDDLGTLGNGAPVWACPASIAASFTERAEPWFANYPHPAVSGCFDALYDDVELQAAFARAWGAVAERVAGLPQVVGYDLYNEPYWGSHPAATWEAEVLAPLYERLAAAIAVHDADGLLFVEPGVNKNLLGTSGLVRPDVGAGVVYAPHLYDPRTEAVGAWDGDLGFVEERLAVDAAEARDLGAGAVYVGEWGVPGRFATDVDFVAQGSAALDAAGVHWAIWQWGPGGPGSYALVDEDGQLQPHAVGLQAPRVLRVAGDALRIEDDGATFAATFTARTTGARTRVAVPPGARVDVDGGAIDEAREGVAEIWAHAAGAPVTVYVER